MSALVGVVAPLVGAWIEIYKDLQTKIFERVAPLVGAWIEIDNIIEWENSLIVAPLVGAWIEIITSTYSQPNSLSLLSWERGLK